MKKLFRVIIVSLLFISCRSYADGYYLNVVNNTEHSTQFCFGYSGIYTSLGAHENIEYFVMSDNVSIQTEYGVIGWYEDRENHADTTVEINDDCYYIGETKYNYWTEK